MTCHLLNERRLFEYADGQLGGVTLELVHGHVDGCAACKGITDDYRELMASLGSKIRPRSEAYDPWAAVRRTIAAPDLLVFALADAVVLREGQEVLTLVSRQLDRIAALAPTDTNAPQILGYVVLWLTDMGLSHFGPGHGRSYLDVASSALERFPAPPRPRYASADSAHLELASGLLALHGERPGEAIKHFEAVLTRYPEVEEPILKSAALGALARAHARQGLYEDSREECQRAIECARDHGYLELAAAYTTRKAWTLYQMEGPRCDEASQLFQSSAEILQETEDWIGRGNIDSALAKIVSHNGQYKKARDLYTTAIALYKEFDGSHPTTARAFVNRAKTQLRSITRLWRTVYNAPVPVRRPTTGVAPQSKLATEAEIRRLLSDARRDIERARKIYERWGDVRGRGAVSLAQAFLYACACRIAEANEEAEAAYKLGVTNSDRILMARARVMQCRLAFAESVESKADPGRSHVLLEQARSFGEEAVKLVTPTQHRRLASAASLWLGITLAHPQLHMRSEACKRLREVRRLMPDGTLDYLHDEVAYLAQSLKADGSKRQLRQSKRINFSRFD